MQKFLIVGLGNIGEKYAKTRHNIGFDVIDEIIQDQGIKGENASFGNIAKFKYKARPIVLLKPDTFMNLSGRAIDYWLKKESIKMENLLVVTDDLNLEFGTVRIKAKGSDGGHNGLKNIQTLLQTVKYPRLRFGVGNHFQEGKQIDYVLSHWKPEEEKEMGERLNHCKKAVYTFVFNGINEAMNRFNGK